MSYQVAAGTQRNAGHNSGAALGGGGGGGVICWLLPSGEHLDSWKETILSMERTGKPGLHQRATGESSQHLSEGIPCNQSL